MRNVLDEMAMLAGIEMSKAVDVSDDKSSLIEGLKVSPRTDFRWIWASSVATFLGATMSVIAKSLKKEGYSVKMKAENDKSTSWLYFEGDDETKVASGEFFFMINRNHILTAVLTVKANENSDVKSGAVMNPKGSTGFDMWDMSPNDVAGHVLMSGNNSLGEVLGIYDY